MDRILRKEEVLRACGISKSTPYPMIPQGKFPRPVRLGQRSVGWKESEVEAWLQSRPRASQT